MINDGHFLADMDRSNSLSHSRDNRTNLQSVCILLLKRQSTWPFPTFAQLNVYIVILFFM